MNTGTGGGTQFRGYFKKLLDLVFQKLSELPEELKASVQLTDLILTSPVKSEKKIEIKTYAAKGIDVKPEVDDKGI